MLNRKTIKAHARGQVKRHYVLLVVLCYISMFLGTEFSNLVREAQSWYDLLNDQVTTVDYDGTLEDRSIEEKILDDLINDNVAAGQERAAAELKKLRVKLNVDPMLARQKGALAAVINSVNSGQLTAVIGTALHSIFHSGRIAAVLLTLGGLALYGLVWIFLRNMYRAVLRRAFMETRVYRVMPVSHLLHFRHTKRWVRASLSLLLAYVYEWLWWLTVVGGFIKHYSYFLVPFIVAENPDVKPREAVQLSRRMMDGHKRACFLLDLSFLGWRVLGFITFGASEALWSLPYRVAAYTEFYAEMRREAKARNLEGAELLNDDCLFLRPDPELLKARYADILRLEEIADGEIVELPTARSFFVRNFGLWTGRLDEKRIYSRQENLRQHIRVSRLEGNGEAYPRRLNPLWNQDVAVLNGRFNPLAPCTVWSLIVVFFAFCMVGWVWEVALHMITHGQFVNRGALHGPWLPIYGSGVVMICVLLYRLRRKPALEALAIVVLCGFVEYMTSYVMEMSRGMRWWDYTGYFLNLNGRICAEGLAVFALGGMAAVYLLVPMIDDAVIRVRPKVLIPVCVALLVCFAGDVVYSRYVPNAGEGITEAAAPESPAGETQKTGEAVE